MVLLQLKSDIFGSIIPAVDTRSQWSSWKVLADSLMGSLLWC